MAALSTSPSIRGLGARLPGRQSLEGMTAIHLPPERIVPDPLLARFPWGRPPGPRLNWREIPRKNRRHLTSTYRG